MRSSLQVDHTVTPSSLLNSVLVKNPVTFVTIAPGEPQKGNLG